MTAGDDPVVAAYLGAVAAALELDRETRLHVLAELRDHVLAAMAELGDDATAVARAVGAMGPAAEVAAALNEVHAGHGMAEALLAIVLPVAGSLALRGLVAATGGGPAVWPQIVWLAAGMLLVAPALRFARWRFAVASWTAFWAMTLLLAGVA